jgi:hypothetical protein
MDHAEAVLVRLDRIRKLDRARAPAARLLDELRLLVSEAEEWARAEGDARARAAASELEAGVVRLEAARFETAAVEQPTARRREPLDSRP